MTLIDVEAHWTTEGIDHALRAQPPEQRDESVSLNDREDIPARLLDLGEQRIAAMDDAGIDIQVISLAPPGTNGLAISEAAELSREANDRASDAVSRHPTRFRSMITLPMSDPAAAVAELERVADDPGHVGIMSYGRCGEHPLDDPIYDDLLATAASLRLPLFIHPQIPPKAVRDASYRGFDPIVELGLSTFGWGWHIEAAIAALRLIVRGAFDRHPDLQIVLGHWGELLLFWLDRLDTLSNVAHLERRVGDYFSSNVHIATSGMLTPRLATHALDYTSIDRILFSSDYPFHRLHAPAVSEFLRTLPGHDAQQQLAHGNAASLYGLTLP